MMHVLMSSLGHLDPERPPQQWVNLFEHVAEYERLYRALLGGKGSSWFVVKMRASLTELVKEHTLVPNKQPIADRRVFINGFLPTLLASLFVDAIIWWLEQEKPYSPGEMAQYCSKLAASIFQEANTWE